MEKYGIAGQTTDNDIIRRMRYVCWINKAIDMNSEYVIFISFFTRTVATRKRLSIKVNMYIAALTFFLNHETSLKVTKLVETFR